MAELVKDAFAGMPWYLYIVIILAIGLLVASFIVPPLGAIHPSVLKGAAEIIAGTWLLYTTANIPKFIDAGAKIRASYGKAKIEITKSNDENQISDDIETRIPDE